MPKGIIKSARDERIWGEAEQVSRTQYGLSPSKDEDAFYKCVNGMYQKKKGHTAFASALSGRQSKDRRQR